MNTMVAKMTYAELVAAEDSQRRACSNGQGSWDYLRIISRELARRCELGLQYV